MMDENKNIEENQMLIHSKDRSVVKKSIPLIEGMSLYHMISEAGISLSAPCAGQGLCGACRIKVLEGELPVTRKDAAIFSEEELQEGWRLACCAYPEKSCAVFVSQERFTTVTNYADQGSKEEETDQEERYGIAIDLGTTTIVCELFSVKTGTAAGTISFTNPQRVYGADVISRIEQSNTGRREILKNILRQTIRQKTEELIKGINLEKLCAIAISGNTVMIHLLMGYTCEGLGRYPFKPVTLDTIESDALRLHLRETPLPVLIAGGISAYVGGDILSGMTAMKMGSEKSVSLYIDLGTNAEMALSDGRGNIYVTSAPAGPAFEAANISCGVGSVEGAVNSICIEGEQQTIKTIGDQDPVGFCGSGVIELVYELLKNHLIDETGLLAEPYFDRGYPVRNLRMTQQDIRQIQLAKSAVISAIQILMKKADVSPLQIQKIYLAGGFGYYLNVQKAIGIGLLLPEFAEKVQTIGNASLYGAKKMLQSADKQQENSQQTLFLREMLFIKENCKEIYLSNENDFQDIFIKNMNFQRWDNGSIV